MDEKSVCCPGNCKHCWAYISKFRVVIGLLLWVGAILLFKQLVEEKPYPWPFFALSLGVPIGLMICRAYFVSARLTTYFFSKAPLEERLLLCIFFALLPVLDVIYFFVGPNKAVVRHFFVEQPQDLLADLAEELKCRDYLCSTSGEELSVHTSDGQYLIKLCDDKICISQNCQSVKVTFCVLDQPFELANIVIAEISKGGVK